MNKIKIFKSFHIIYHVAGTDDCGDQSDEASSVCSNFNCDTLRRFQCDNHRCIARYQICDGMFYSLPLYLPLFSLNFKKVTDF